MADDKEPGRLPFEVACPPLFGSPTWGQLDVGVKAMWAAVEAAVMEKAARIAEDLIEQRRGQSLSFDMIAAAIRAAKEG